MIKTQYSRYINKLSSISGETPTIGPSDDHTDGTWTASTMIYPGEIFINQQDQKVYIGYQTGTTYTGVHQFYPPTGPSGGVNFNFTETGNDFTINGTSPNYTISGSVAQDATNVPGLTYYNFNIGLAAGANTINIAGFTTGQSILRRDYVTIYDNVSKVTSIFEGECIATENSSTTATIINSNFYTNNGVLLDVTLTYTTQGTNSIIDVTTGSNFSASTLNIRSHYLTI